jgi:hypothetical protein
MQGLIKKNQQKTEKNYKNVTYGRPSYPFRRARYSRQPVSELSSLHPDLCAGWLGSAFFLGNR